MARPVQYTDRVLASDDLPAQYRSDAAIREVRTVLPRRWQAAPARSGNGYHSHGLGLKQPQLSAVIDPVQTCGLGACVVVGVALFLAFRCKLPR
jgi:hypothetical protein